VPAGSAGWRYLVSERAEPITDGDSEGQFRTLAADIPGAVFRRAAESPWRFEHISDAIEKITGRRSGAVDHARNLADVPLAVPEDQPAVGAAIARAVSTGQPYEIEYRVRHADGTIHWVRDLGFPVPDGKWPVGFDRRRDL
jgi:PAS domain-containing protein